MRGGKVNRWRSQAAFPEHGDLYPILLEGYSEGDGPTLYRARSAVTGQVWAGIEGCRTAEECETLIMARKEELNATGSDS